MPTIERSGALRLLSALAVASTLAVSGCGGSEPPQGKVKPATSVDPEIEAALKRMQAEAKPLPKAEEPEKPKTSKKGVGRGGVRKKQ